MFRNRRAKIVATVGPASASSAGDTVRFVLATDNGNEGCIPLPHPEIGSDCACHDPSNAGTALTHSDPRIGRALRYSTIARHRPYAMSDRAGL
jgi:hypothetical protein